METLKSASINIAFILSCSTLLFGILSLIFKNRINYLKDKIKDLEVSKNIIEERNKILLESNKMLNNKIDSIEQKGVTSEIEYSRSESNNFYNEIAEVYDVDNSKEIWETHRTIARELNKLTQEKEQVSVIDIGGGTGALLFDLLSYNDKIRWTYVDASSKMCDLFRNKSNNSKYPVEIINDSFDNILNWNKDKFDVIIISFLFSSLPNIPNLLRIKNLLKSNGKIIFADADRDYSKRLPYRVISNNIAHILKTKPLKLSDVLAEFTSAGFSSNVAPTIKKNGETYSHVVIFEEKNNGNI